MSANATRAKLLTCLAAGLGGASLVVVMAVTGTPAAFDSALDWAKQYIVERRSDAILAAQVLDGKGGKGAVAEIRVASDCVGFTQPCSYGTTEYMVVINGEQGEVRFRRHFDSAALPSTSNPALPLKRCIFQSQSIPLDPLEARRLTALLTLPHFLEFKSIDGNEPTDTNPTHLSIVLDGQRLFVSILGEHSAPQRLRNLVALVHRQAESKIRIPEVPPDAKDCVYPPIPDFMSPDAPPSSLETLPGLAPRSDIENGKEGRDAR